MNVVTVKYVDKKPMLDNPILIEGLPGIGNVGKLAVEHLIETTNAKKFAERYEKVEIREGIFEEELVKFADEVNAGLVVIGREMKKRSMNREVRKDIAENIHHSVLFLN